MFQLRPYQTNIKNAIRNAWNSGKKNVLAVLPTGAGKTVTFADVISEHKGASCAIAHRQELVGQISLALARDKIRHKIIGPKSVVKLCVNQHMHELGVSYYDPNAKTAVAGVDTLVKRKTELAAWLKSVTLWVQDEAHHVLDDNKWGTAAKMFPNAIGLGVTATPERADGVGLGRHADGLFDVMVEGPSMRDLINMGYLTDYRIFAPEQHLIMDEKDIGSTGDFKHHAVVREFRKAKNKIIGDVVSQYIKHANGKLGITFVPDVEDAIDTAAAYTARGVPAKVVSAKTPDSERIQILRDFKSRKLLQLVNVDLFGEGFDLPAIEVVSMARPTQSYALFVQQFGRALRLMLDKDVSKNWDSYTDEERRALIAQSSKPHAIIIDHVGNVQRHGLPDAFRTWSLGRKEKRGRRGVDDSIPVRTCAECTAVYERVISHCPLCGHHPEPISRSSPEHVDGDLIELSPATLAQLRGEIEKVDMDPAEFRAELVKRHVPLIGQQAHTKRHVERQQAIKALRESIGWWGAWQRALDRTDSESYKRFYFMFGIDVATAQTLKTKDALALAEKINYKLGSLQNSA